MTRPTKVELTEVGPRDGLQAEPKFVETEIKIQLVNDLIAAGVPRIEFSSFVSPRAVPQLADVAEVFEGIDKSGPTVLAALVPNAKGAVRAVDAGIDEIIVFLSASESHNKKNVNRSVEESLVGFEEVARIAATSNIPVQGVIATAFGCPFEGDIPIAQISAGCVGQNPTRPCVLEVVGRTDLLESGVHPCRAIADLGDKGRNQRSPITLGKKRRVQIRRTVVAGLDLYKRPTREGRVGVSEEIWHGERVGLRETDQLLRISRKAFIDPDLLVFIPVPVNQMLEFVRQGPAGKVTESTDSELIQIEQVATQFRDGMVGNAGIKQSDQTGVWKIGDQQKDLRIPVHIGWFAEDLDG